MTQEPKPTKTLWLRMLAEGGRWKSAEAGEALAMDQWSARALLNSMVAAGSAVRFEPFGESTTYTFGVTINCKIPQGITLAELTAIGIIKEAA